MSKKKLEITDEFLKEVGITRELYTEYDEMMNEVWKALNSNFKGVTQPSGHIVKGKYRVTGSFVNSAYVDITVREGETEILNMRNRNFARLTGGIIVMLFTGFEFKADELKKGKK